MRFILLLSAAAVLLVACGKPADDGPQSASAAAATPGKADGASLLLAPQDLLTVSASSQRHGPVISGSIQPSRRADLRAEVQAVVTRVLKDNGETVRSGELLMQLDDTAVRDMLMSAQEAVRASERSQTQAERQLERLRTLQKQGMATTQSVEDAEVRYNNAQSDLVAARAREVSARQQLQRTLVRAPFDGVVSERKASVGDTVQVGRELVKVIDPASMRFEGAASADRLADLKAGQPVRFRINGIGSGPFDGRIERVDPSANPTTRQVEVIVTFNDPAAAPRVAGLFAEGQVVASGPSALTLPDSAVVKDGEKDVVWRIGDKRLERVVVQLGERDSRTGERPVRAGLKEGDRILRHPGSSLTDGQAIELTGNT
jgi:membrane fusion protein (multidrug efflux system)